MPKKKLKRFVENTSFKHLIQPDYKEVRNGLDLKGNWNSKFFRNNNPIVLELGCGKGEYTIGLAEAYPDRNFIGVDIKGARLWAGCKQVVEKDLKNVAFIRTEIGMIDHCFEENEITEIWLTFPDPHPKERNEKKRLTSPRYLSKYSGFLKPESLIHLKTDNVMLITIHLKSLIQESINFTMPLQIYIIPIIKMMLQKSKLFMKPNFLKKVC